MTKPVGTVPPPAHHTHFADRDALVLVLVLVLAALEHCHPDLRHTVDQAESGAADPVAALRARAALLGAWSREHPGLYKALHESTLNQRTDMSFKEEMAKRTTAAIRRCMDAGLATPGDAETVSLDLCTAVHSAVPPRVNQPERPWPPWEEQVDRFLTKLVGIPPAAGWRRWRQAAVRPGPVPLLRRTEPVQVLRKPLDPTSAPRGTPQTDH
jgi:hypothetical protein